MGPRPCTAINPKAAQRAPQLQHHNTTTPQRRTQKHRQQSSVPKRQRLWWFVLAFWWPFRALFPMGVVGASVLVSSCAPRPDYVLVYGGRSGLRVPTSGRRAVQLLSPLCMFEHLIGMKPPGEPVCRRLAGGWFCVCRRLAGRCARVCRRVVCRPLRYSLTKRAGRPETDTNQIGAGQGNQAKAHDPTLCQWFQPPCNPLTAPSMRDFELRLCHRAAAVPNCSFVDGASERKTPAGIRNRCTNVRAKLPASVAPSRLRCRLFSLRSSGSWTSRLCSLWFVRLSPPCSLRL